MACKITFNNPVSGINHTSLVGYLLTSAGVSNEDAIKEINKMSNIKRGNEDWHNIYGEKEPGLYKETSIEDSKKLLERQGKLDDISWMRDVQEIYENNNLSLDQEFTLNQLKGLLSNIEYNPESSFTFLIEELNGEKVSKGGTKSYKIYPVKGTYKNKIELKNKLNSEISKEIPFNQTTKFKKFSEVVDFVTPNVSTTIDRLLLHPDVSDEVKKQFRDILPYLGLNPNLKLNISDFQSYKFDTQGMSELDKKFNLYGSNAGSYNLLTNTITLHLREDSIETMEDLAKTILHEAQHSVTVGALLNPRTKAEKQLANTLNQAYEEYKHLLNEKSVKEVNYYGFSDPFEFAVAFLSNPVFRDVLKENQKTKPFYQRVVDIFTNFFKSMFGMSNMTPNITVEGIQKTIDNYFEELNKTQNLNLEVVNLNKQHVFNSVITPEAHQKFQSKFSTPNDYRELLRELLDSENISWNKIMQEAKAINLNLDSLSNIEELYNQITEGDIKKSVESLYNFLYETSRYLRSIEKSLDYLFENGTVSEGELFRRTYHARELGQYFSEYIQDLQDTFQNKISGTLLESPVKNIAAISDALIKKYTTNASNAIASKLAQEFEKPTAKLKLELENNIKRLEKIYDSAVKANNSNLARQTQNKIAKEREQLKQVATVQNLKAALKGKIKDVSQISLYLESAALTGNLLTGTIGGFISNLFDNANAEAIGIEVRGKRIANKLEAYIKSTNRGATLTGFTLAQAYEPFLQRRKIKEIKNNQLIERESYFLVSEMDELSYLNDRVQLKFDIKQLENNPNQTEAIRKEIDKKKKELETLQDTYEESQYTEEYYQIQNLLSDEARDARELILAEMRTMRISAVEIEQTDEILDKLSDLKVKLTQLESDYDEYGKLKDEEGLRIAKNIRTWKENRSAAELIRYEITPEHRELFDTKYKQYTEAVENSKIDYDQAVAANDPEVEFYENKYNQKKKELEVWLNNNAVRKIDKAFYVQRDLILNRIKEIQGRYRNVEDSQPITELYSQLFAMLRSYKNEDGYYEGSKVSEEKVDDNGNQINLAIRVKQVEEKIENLKEKLNDNTKIDKADKEELNNLFSRLSAMQEKVNTPDYDRVVSIKKAEIRSQIIANPKNSGLTRPAIEALVNQELRKTDWFKENHKVVMKYDPKVGSSYKDFEPIFFWRTTQPADSKFISYNNPSFRWYTYKVNEKYINKNKDYFRTNKRVALKKTQTKYKNSQYSTLNNTQREILKEMIDFYTDLNKGLPFSLTRGLEIPFVEKEGVEGLGAQRVGTLTGQIKGAVNSLVSDVTFQQDDDLASSDSERGSILSKAQRRLYLRYSRPIDSNNIDRVSVNLLNSFVRFGADAARFKQAYSNLSYIYGIQDVLEKQMPDTNIRKVINNMLERRLNGQTTKTWTDNKLVNAAEWAINKSISMGANMALSLRLPSTIKNAAAGTANIFIQADLYGLSRSDIFKAQGTVSKNIAPLFKSYIEDGIENEYMQKVRYFNIMPDDHLSNAGKRVFVSEFDKGSKQYNPLQYLSFLRNFGEFEMRASVAEALSKRYLIQHTNGKLVPIMDSFELVDGVLTPMSTIENLEDFNNVVQHFRGELNTINSYIHGAYGYMDKAEYTRYTLGRVLGTMKGWLVMQTMRRFGRRSIAYRGGMESQGFYRTLLQSMGLFIGNRSLINTWELLSTREKNEVIAAGYDTLALGIAVALSSVLSALVYSDDDDDDDHALLYFTLYNILQVEDELATLHPIAGPLAIGYSRFYNNPDGKSAPVYYLEKTFVLPFRNVYDMLKLSYEVLNPFDDIDAFNEYVPRSRNGNVLNPKRYPPNPTLKGLNEITARSMRLFGLDASWNYTFGSSSEYLFRVYHNYNERWFLDSLNSDLSGVKRDINSYKKEIKSIQSQLDYTDDEDTKDSLQEIIKELQNDIVDRKKDLTELSNFSSENDMQ